MKPKFALKQHSWYEIQVMESVRFLKSDFFPCNFQGIWMQSVIGLTIEHTIQIQEKKK